MIESILSNESGEEGKLGKIQTSFKIPKNVRQIGKSSAVKKIYVEDYVMTFTKQLAGGDFSGLKIAVLVGQCIRLDNCRNIFISGAVEAKNLENSSGEIIFSNETWTTIYEDIKKYYVDNEIVGWFLGGPGYLLADEEKIQKIHINNFAGQDKTLLTYDNMEREEAFYSFENNRLTKQDGYYIYYEKNDEMQNYMIESRKGQSAEVSYDDRVSRDIRTVLQNKKSPEEEGKSATRLMYAAGTLLAVIILVVGAAILSNYDQMKSMQSSLNYLTSNVEKLQTMVSDGDSTQTTAGAKDATAYDTGDAEGNSDTLENSEMSDSEDGTGEQSLNVEVVPGDVKPMEDTDNADIAESDEPNQDNEESSPGEDLAEDDANAAEDVVEKVVEKPEVKKASQEEVSYYTVVSGDTLAGISHKLYNTYTKVNTIMKLNNIEDQDHIIVGQKLIVP